MRNTILLSLLLGLTWIVGLIPTFAVQEYIFVILNTIPGVYILAYSVLANRQVRGEVRERVSVRVTEIVSTYMSSDEQTQDTKSEKWYRRNKHTLKSAAPETTQKDFESE